MPQAKNEDIDTALATGTAAVTLNESGAMEDSSMEGSTTDTTTQGCALSCPLNGRLDTMPLEIVVRICDALRWQRTYPRGSARPFCCDYDTVRDPTVQPDQQSLAALSMACRVLRWPAQRALFRAPYISDSVAMQRFVNTIDTRRDLRWAMDQLHDNRFSADCHSPEGFPRPLTYEASLESVASMLSSRVRRAHLTADLAPPGHTGGGRSSSNNAHNPGTDAAAGPAPANTGFFSPQSIHRGQTLAAAAEAADPGKPISALRELIVRAANWDYRGDLSRLPLPQAVLDHLTVIEIGDCRWRLSWHEGGPPVPTWVFRRMMETGGSLGGSGFGPFGVFSPYGAFGPTNPNHHNPPGGGHTSVPDGYWSEDDDEMADIDLDGRLNPRRRRVPDPLPAPEPLPEALAVVLFPRLTELRLHSYKAPLLRLPATLARVGDGLTRISIQMTRSNTLHAGSRCLDSLLRALLPWRGTLTDITLFSDRHYYTVPAPRDARCVRWLPLFGRLRVLRLECAYLPLARVPGCLASYLPAAIEQLQLLGESCSSSALLDALSRLLCAASSNPAPLLASPTPLPAPLSMEALRLGIRARNEEAAKQKEKRKAERAAKANLAKLAEQTEQAEQADKGGQSTQGEQGERSAEDGDDEWEIRHHGRPSSARRNSWRTVKYRKAGKGRKADKGRKPARAGPVEEDEEAAEEGPLRATIPRDNSTLPRLRHVLIDYQGYNVGSASATAYESLRKKFRREGVELETEEICYIGIPRGLREGQHPKHRH